MPPRWEPSSDKHDVPRTDQVHAILNASYIADLGTSDDGGTLRLYIGPEHAQTDRELEILVNHFTDGREASIFHAMQLGPKFRRYREENPHG
jgi:hypothetical protein